jgi:transcriptional regulator with XRE-family HTH domain
VIHEIRDHLDIHQARIAEWAQVGQPQVSRWVSGQSRPRYDTMRTLLRAIIDQAPNDQKLRKLATELADAAGYPGMLDIIDIGDPSPTSAEPEHLQGDGRYAVTARWVDTPFGKVLEEIVEDLEADTEDWGDDEVAEAEKELAATFQRQYAAYMEAKEALRERRRRRSRDAG